MKTKKNIQTNAKRGELGRVAVKLFLGITDDWDLTENEKLVLAGHESRTTLNQWRQKVEANEDIKLSRDTLERLSYVAGIYKALQLLFPNPEQWSNWIRRPNRDFGGNPALEHMLGGKVVDLADVRRYLDSWRGSHFE
ncbi:MAG: hypothetical protein ACI82A_002668 [Candidatus Azotimanducaceae bacterium]|jgi:hypothetical protein